MKGRRVAADASFFVKRVPEVRPPGAHMIPEGAAEEARKTADQVNEWLRRHKNATMWDKQKNPVDFQSQGVKTQTGMQLLGSTT